MFLTPGGGKNEPLKYISISSKYSTNRAGSFRLRNPENYTFLNHRISDLPNHRTTILPYQRPAIHPDPGHAGSASDEWMETVNLQLWSRRDHIRQGR